MVQDDAWTKPGKVRTRIAENAATILFMAKLLSLLYKFLAVYITFCTKGHRR
jgi:hypothetical protein